VNVTAPAVGELLGLATVAADTGISAVGDTLKSAASNPYIGTLGEHLCPA